jgi:hypothetical protein
MLANLKNDSPFSKNEHFFRYFLRSIVNTKRAGCRPSSEFTKEFSDAFASGSVAKIEAIRRKELLISAGGMNHNAYFADRLSNDLYKRQDIHFLEGMFFLEGQLYAALYARDAKEPGDDPYNVEVCYKALDIKANRTDIRRAGAYSMLLSGTTYRIIYSVWNELLHTGRRAAPLSVFGIRVPDIIPYTTMRGISYKLISEYEVCDDIHILFGGERVLYGESTTELNIGLEHQLGEAWRSLSYKAVLTFGKHFDVEASLSLPILERLSVSLGGGLYDRDSLLGERHTRNFKRRYSSNIFLSFSFLY